MGKRTDIPPGRAVRRLKPFPVRGMNAAILDLCVLSSSTQFLILYVRDIPRIQFQRYVVFG